MNKNIDIHIHILPGVDDGSESMECTIEMLQCAYEQGVRKIIATPHFDGRQTASVEELKELTEQVQKQAHFIAEDYQIYLGNEIYYQEGCLEALKDGDICTMAGSRYVLVEFSIEEAYKTIYNGMRNFILEGYCPIIAHMERYQCLYKKEERVEELINLGCYMQMNAGSFFGGFFNKRASYAKKLVAQHYIHFIASDSHNMTTRKNQIGECREILSKIIEEPLLNKIFYENQQRVIDNKFI